MSVIVTLTDKVANHLANLPMNDVHNIDDKLIKLLEAEYRRRLARYTLTDRQFSQKYQMSFSDFETQQVAQMHDYSWEVESDAITWETASDGIETIQWRLSELLELPN